MTERSSAKVTLGSRPDGRGHPDMPMIMHSCAPTLFTILRHLTLRVIGFLLKHEEFLAVSVPLGADSFKEASRLLTSLFGVNRTIVFFCPSPNLPIHECPVAPALVPFLGFDVRQAPLVRESVSRF